MLVGSDPALNGLPELLLPGLLTAAGIICQPLSGSLPDVTAEQGGRYFKPMTLSVREFEVKIRS